MADLTTIENVKQWLSIGGTADDGLLERLISAISDRVRKFLQRDILTGSYVYTFNGTGGQRWPLQQWPITAVASVTIDGVSIPVASGPTGIGFYFSTDLVYLRGYNFTRGWANVTVTYTAGYTEVPPDIEQAVIEWLALRYKERDRVGHQSKSIGGETVTFFIGAMPASVKAALQQWMNVVPT